ncbi:hypothetical protein LIER_18428 [Lithospermum erythrorhizon]|uniref:PROP1-like PPR domain-containing protein n=1 Tax=Lithospermum erythrorhizon TaxID=34254 RepID=A0AAV3QGJ1_LITER
MMWALRRASNPIKKGLSGKTYRLVQAPLEVARCNLDRHIAGFYESVLVVSDESLFGARGFSSASGSQNLFTGVRCFSSQAGTQSSGEDGDDLEDGFSELEGSTDADSIQHKKVDDDLTSESELSGEESGDDTIDLPEDELNLLDTESDANEKKLYRKRVHSELFKVISAAKNANLSGVLNKWVEEGNEVTRKEILLSFLNLRKRHMYFKALQLSEWLESMKHLEFSERDYASRLDLIAKVHGVAKAENYLQKIPKSFKTEVIYRTLLASHVSYMNVKKAEDVFNKMKDLGFPITSFSCNQLLVLYKRTDKKKLTDVLLLMEKEDVKPSPFTYRILIDAKGQTNDIHGMEQIVETMKAEGVMPDHETQVIMARHYTSAGLKEKAEAILKEMEGNDLEENRFACQSLIPLYAALGKAEEVRRIWEVCGSNPRLAECKAAVEAWGKLQNVEEAEAIFDEMTTKWTKLSSMHYTVLLKVYADNKMLAKGKDLVKQMANKGFRIGPLTWDAVVKLYVETGEVEKADSVLQKASEQNRLRPMFSSYLTIMEQYAKRGDVHNTEKMFHRMRLAGYVSRLRQFQTLIKAYTNAKAPAYGFSERMKADNVFPNKGLAAQLSLVDPFKKSVVSDLLD